MNNLNNPTQAAPSCPLCCAKKDQPHSAGCKNAEAPCITMTPLLRRALEDWARNCESGPRADAALLDLLNLMAGPASGATDVRNAALEDQRDAERYRWLRACGPQFNDLPILDMCENMIADKLDNAIDAAIRSLNNKR
ncbi:hypothetical protein IV454_16195 [Massilia antarctica]|uniref:Uncharacterized protein n=1 Tax=Massilia antarctica TaxID=2765360 RepID=A0AA48WJJ6_9BURK|nr:hypothetical protein [Massilia antarctica]QPI52888.1 hypothetical protein IV454_16195 [Massilia antarctica]